MRGDDERRMTDDPEGACYCSRVFVHRRKLLIFIIYVDTGTEGSHVHQRHWASTRSMEHREEEK